MITIDDLIWDEKEAIAGYREFMNQGVDNPKKIFAIKRIITDEERHIKELKKL